MFHAAPAQALAGRNPQAKDDMIRHIHHAKAIGATVMRVVGSSFSFVRDPHEPQLRIISEWFQEAVRVAAGESVSLAVENHINYDAPANPAHGVSQRHPQADLALLSVAPRADFRSGVSGPPAADDPGHGRGLHRSATAFSADGRYLAARMARFGGLARAASGVG